MGQLRMFLSHSSRDKAQADAFATAFRQAGADVWYDEDGLGAGHLRRTIMKELGGRPIFVVLLSHAALASSWVLDECEWAYDLQRDDPSRAILPVVVEQLERTDLNAALYLRSLKRVEAGDLRPLPIAQAAVEALRLLGMAAPAGASEFHPPFLTPSGPVVTPSGSFPPPAAPSTPWPGAPAASTPHTPAPIPSPVAQPVETATDLVLRGKGLSAQGQHGAAIPVFERATRLEPGNWEAWFNLGYSCGEAERYTDALMAYERAAAIKPNDSVTWSNKATALINLNRNQEALEACERAITLQPDLANAWTNKAGALSATGRPTEGLAAAERAISLRAEDAVAWNNKGDALNLLNRPSEGLEAAERGLTIDPRYRLLWGTKGRSLELLRRYQEALAAYDQSLALRATYPYGLSGKARVLRALNRVAEAEAVERTLKQLGA